MLEVLGVITMLVFMAFGFYALFTAIKWMKVAKKLDKQLDEAQEATDANER